MLFVVCCFIVACDFILCEKEVYTLTVVSPLTISSDHVYIHVFCENHTTKKPSDGRFSLV